MKKRSHYWFGLAGMPLALSLMGRGYDVVGSKTTLDGVEAARDERHRNAINWS